MVKPLIVQTDFGLGDAAVSAMYGVAYSVSDNIRMFDSTHDIRPYNIWEASYRLIQTVSYWVEGSVFVSVVDPGVGSNRRSIVVKVSSGQYIVTPDNGTLTHVKKLIGIVAAREIDENFNRLPNSGESYTFHGRDVYAYTGARLAAGIIDFESVGPEINVDDIVELPTFPATCENGIISGTIDVLDIRFGSLWTNIPREMFKKIGIEFGQRVEITITHEHSLVYKNIMTYAKSFADVSIGETLLYSNSLDRMAVAINQGSFAKAYNVGSGTNWKISIRKSQYVKHQNLFMSKNNLTKIE